MITYYGKHFTKHFIKGKSIRFGYKIRCLAQPRIPYPVPTAHWEVCQSAGCQAWWLYGYGAFRFIATGCKTSGHFGQLLRIPLLLSGRLSMRRESVPHHPEGRPREGLEDPNNPGKAVFSTTPLLLGRCHTPIKKVTHYFKHTERRRMPLKSRVVFFPTETWELLTERSEAKTTTSSLRFIPRRF